MSSVLCIVFTYQSLIVIVIAKNYQALHLVLLQFNNTHELNMMKQLLLVKVEFPHVDKIYHNVLLHASAGLIEHVYLLLCLEWRETTRGVSSLSRIDKCDVARYLVLGLRMCAGD